MLFLEHAVTPLDAELAFADELPHYSVSEVQISDFDDTLSDTSLAVGALLQICQSFGLGGSVNTQTIAEARERAWRRGGSYDMLKLLEEHLDKPTIDAVREQFRRGDDGPVIAFDDAKRYQERVRSMAYVPHFVMTYGENIGGYADGGWQRDKLERASNQGWWPTGFAYLMSHSRKGPEVMSLQNPDTGDYDFIGLDDKGGPLAMFSAKYALFIDDRKTSLSCAPYSSKPVYIRRSGQKPTPKQTQGTLPRAARTICSLDEISVKTRIRPVNNAASEIDPASLRVAAFVPLEFLKNHVRLDSSTNS
ncbi:MAG TPA: hypothetical protein VFT16_03285 [Candidatus Saccharimonadales bacterium]|nr:hypothetical protein [Candidatus Saccharimonadales bacterium]